MNYVTAVYGVVVVIIIIDWFVRGKRHYRSQAKRHEDAAAKVGMEGTIGTGIKY